MKEKIIGTWKLIEAKDLGADGQWTYPFGTSPSGYFMYDKSGHASVQIMITPPIRMAGDHPSSDEALKIYNGYIAYYGTYTLTEKPRQIIHHVEGAWNPTQVESDQVRPFDFIDDKLILGDQKTWIRVLERVN